MLLLFKNHSNDSSLLKISPSLDALMKGQSHSSYLTLFFKKLFFGLSLGIVDLVVLTQSAEGLRCTLPKR